MNWHPFKTEPFKAPTWRCWNILRPLTSQPRWPWPQGRWSRNGTGSGTRRDSGGAGGFRGNGLGLVGVFRGDHGEGPFLFGWNLSEGCYIYNICKLYIFVFQNVIIDSWCPRNFTWFPPKKMMDVGMVLGMCFFWYSMVFRSKGRGTVLVDPEKSGLQNSSEAKQHLSMTLGGLSFCRWFFSGGKV